MPDITELLASVGATDGFPDLSRVPYHLGLATNDVDQARDTLTALMGCTWTDPEDQTNIPFFDGHGEVVQSCRTSHSRIGPFSLELLEGAPGSVWESDRLIELHHLGFWSTDVPGDVRNLLDRGWSIDLTFLDDAGEYYRFAYLSKPDTLRVEFADARWRYGTHVNRLGTHVQIAV